MSLTSGVARTDRKTSRRGLRPAALPANRPTIARKCPPASFAASTCHLQGPSYAHDFTTFSLGSLCALWQNRSFSTATISLPQMQQPHYSSHVRCHTTQHSPFICVTRLADAFYFQLLNRSPALGKAAASPFTAHLGHYSRYTFACISTIDIAQTCAITRAKR